MGAIWSLLRPNGTCYLTVPYGKEYIVHGKDWRVYHAASLQERIIQDFKVEQKIFFKSAHAACPDDGEAIPLVEENVANDYDGSPPHLTIFIKLRITITLAEGLKSTVTMHRTNRPFNKFVVVTFLRMSFKLMGDQFAPVRSISVLYGFLLAFSVLKLKG